ncbi:MAG: MBL fold metallo-hydrolase [Deltaproteobacteria bacterium]|nr:MBL fold metallo-hydrolase [Deltaproteobacteria bacterium]
MIQEIGDHFFMLTLPMPFRLGHVNIFAIIHHKRVFLFDTGIHFPQTMPKLEEFLNELHLSPARVDRIFITHYHADHCGVAGEIKRMSGAQILASHAGNEIRQSQKNEGDVIAKIRHFYHEHGMPADLIHALTELFRHFRKATVPFDVDVCLDDGEICSIGDRSFKCITTPGHSRDHMCYYFPGEGILLAGDHVLPDITPNLSPDLFDRTFRPLKCFLDSLARIENLPVSKVFPAHGSPYTDLTGRIQAIRKHHEERKRLTLRALEHGEKTTFQVSHDIFGTDLKEFDEFLALNETYVHIIELVEEGLVEEIHRGELISYLGIDSHTVIG